MPSASAPRILTTAPGAPFADAVARHMLNAAPPGARGLADTLLLLPNRRSARALTDAFVRAGGEKGLLLPRMLPVADLDDAEAGMAWLEAGDAPEALPILHPQRRRMLLARLVHRFTAAMRGDAGMAEALRLADMLGRTLDQLSIYAVDPARLRDVIEATELARHWQPTLDFLELLIAAWPAILSEERAVDAAQRRIAQVERLARRWELAPPLQAVVAAGIVQAPPAIARMLGIIARLPAGTVVLPGLDLAMDDDAWNGLGPGDEAHPQFALKQLLDGMDAARAEVGTVAGPPVRARRSALVTRAMLPAAFTERWRAAAHEAPDFTGLRCVCAANPAEEARVIALALRRALETPGRTASLVTPDRALARRVRVLLKRWSIDIDDSAGQPLAETPPAMLLRLLLDAVRQQWAPVALLALCKHPLVFAGEGRLRWLETVRALDLALRGLRPAPGLEAVLARAPAPGALDPLRAALAPVAAMLPESGIHLGAAARALADTLTALAGDETWRGPEGRALAQVLADVAAHGDVVGALRADELADVVAQLLHGAAVRQPYRRHPRLALLGLLEARLQQFDLVILGGLNQGVWPAVPASDPWLPPRVRRILGLPGLERATGLAAHDFVQLLGAPEVLLTRAQRDAQAPALPSSLWLRINAVAGVPVPCDEELLAAARALQRPERVQPAERPQPSPPMTARPRVISVTGADKLAADPYSFYVERILRLDALDDIDAEPDSGQRGTLVHAILERYAAGGEDPAQIDALVTEAFAALGASPMLRALWLPRVLRMVHWAGEQIAARRAEGWQVFAAEKAYEAPIGAVVVKGRADRIEVRGEALAIIDFKTGGSPPHAQLEEGYALQMGLLAELAAGAERRPVEHLSYWLLKGGNEPGKPVDPLLLKGKPWTDIESFRRACRARLLELADRYLVGGAPFTAKAHSLYAEKYKAFDHLARVAEWQGRAP